ncbi:MAG: hypothetical protein QGG09_12815 [Pirellulaceae bacterium]|nr:hypothetical protein [Pirellulaceae bacterium]HJN09780.1 hypothetical protein [Pirellulaceae bacterium]
MGGIGSENWYRFTKKSTVEESLTVAMRDFRSRRFWRSSGTLTWSWAAGNASSVGYRVTWGCAPTITLHYRWRDNEDIEIPIRLQTTPTQFGGERWWFTCPLIVSGVACNRRVGKLHLAPGARYFGCRKCHELTYRSSQEAHLDQRKGGAWLRMIREIDLLNRKRGAM